MSVWPINRRGRDARSSKSVRFGLPHKRKYSRAWPTKWENRPRHGRLSPRMLERAVWSDVPIELRAIEDQARHRDDCDIVGVHLGVGQRGRTMRVRGCVLCHVRHLPRASLGALHLPELRSGHYTGVLPIRTRQMGAMLRVIGEVPINALAPVAAPVRDSAGDVRDYCAPDCDWKSALGLNRSPHSRAITFAGNDARTASNACAA
jgi:hypothetical protein